MIETKSGAKLDVRVYPIEEPEGNTKAFANVAIDDLVVIRGLRIVDSEKGLFVSMPQAQDTHGDFYDTAFPLTSDLRKDISQIVLVEHDRVTKLAPEQRGYEKRNLEAAGKIDIANVGLDIRVTPLRFPKRGTKAYASVSVNGLVAIRDIRVVGGRKDLFVAMPQSQGKDKKYHDVAYPLNADLRNKIHNGILEKYEAERPAHHKPPRPTLDERLAAGAERAAGHVTPDRAIAKGPPGLGA